jgi:hypothetical protein
MQSENNYEISRDWFFKKKEEWDSKKKIFEKYSTIDAFNSYVQKQIQKSIDSKIQKPTIAYVSLPANNVFFYSSNPDFLITIHQYRAINQFKEVVDLIRFESNEISKITIDNEKGEILSKDIWLKQLVNSKIILDYEKYSQGSYFKFPSNVQYQKPIHMLNQDNRDEFIWHYTNENIHGEVSYPSKNKNDPWYSVILPFNTKAVTHSFVVNSFKEYYEINLSSHSVEDFILDIERNVDLSNPEKNTIIMEFLSSKPEFAELLEEIKKNILKNPKEYSKEQLEFFMSFKKL